MSFKIFGPCANLILIHVYSLVQVKAKYMDTGSYLRPHDILYCLEKTKFNEESIISWFKRYTQLAERDSVTIFLLHVYYMNPYPSLLDTKISSFRNFVDTCH